MLRNKFLKHMGAIYKCASEFYKKVHFVTNHRKSHKKLTTSCSVNWPCSKVPNSSFRALMTLWPSIQSLLRETCFSLVVSQNYKTFSVPTCSTFHQWRSKCAKTNKISYTPIFVSWNSALLRREYISWTMAYRFTCTLQKYATQFC